MGPGGVAAIQAGEGLAASAANVAIAERQMRFQERMSSTAHQREVKDLLAAGLNPILSSKYGGSSTPSGASANIQPTSAAQAYLNASLAKQNIATAKSQENANSANAVATKNSMKVQNANAALTSAQAEAVRADTEKKKITGKFYKETGKIVNPTIEGAGKFLRDLWNKFKKHGKDIKYPGYPILNN